MGARETWGGSPESHHGQHDFEDIYRDRKTFSENVFQVATTDMVNMGMQIVSYTLKDLKDDVGYLHSLGEARTAEVQRDARIGEAEANMQSTMAEALAEEQRIQAKLLNDTEISRAKRDFDLKKASYDVEVNAANAEANMAYDLQKAIQQQKIEEQKQQVKVVERLQQIQISEQEIFRKEKLLDSTVKKPAEAEKFRLEKIAEANKQVLILEAEAAAESVQLKGEAEAFAIEAKAKAEAEQMAKKADAWGEYGKAAVIDMILQTLPKVAAEVSVPLSQANRVTMVAQGDGEIGAARLTEEVMAIINKVPDAVKHMTGVDINAAVQQTSV